MFLEDPCLSMMKRCETSLQERVLTVHEFESSYAGGCKTPSKTDQEVAPGCMQLKSVWL